MGKILLTCPYCEPWVATTRAQLATRKKNLALGGDLYACPKCGTRDWAMSEAKLGEPTHDRRSKLIAGIVLTVFILICATASVYLSR